MDDERMQAGWAELSAEVEQELGAQRRAHPRATFGELERVTREATSRLQARYLEDLARTRAGGGLAGGATRRAPGLPDVRRAARGAGAAYAAGAAGTAAGRRAGGASVWVLPGLQGRVFPPWMRNWNSCLGN